MSVRRGAVSWTVSGQTANIGKLDKVSAPAVPYPKWMVLRYNLAEDVRTRVLHPEQYEDGDPWRHLRG
jgi:hypothetical protein